MDTSSSLRSSSPTSPDYADTVIAGRSWLKKSRPGAQTVSVCKFRISRVDEMLASLIQVAYVPECAKRWTHCLDPALDRSEWTPEEVSSKRSNPLTIIAQRIECRPAQSEPMRLICPV